MQYLFFYFLSWLHVIFNFFMILTAVISTSKEHKNVDTNKKLLFSKTTDYKGINGE